MGTITKKSGANRIMCFGQYDGTGAIPASPVAVYFRNTKDSIDGKTEQIKSSEMLPGRSKSKPRMGGSSNGGGVDFEFSALTFDRLLSGLFMSNWVQDGTNPCIATLVPGNIKKLFWTLKNFTEPDKPLFQLFQKMVVDSLDLSFALNAIVTGTFSFMGSNDPLLVATNPVSGLSVFPTALTNDTFTTRLGFLKVDGVAYTDAKEFKVSFKNNYARLAALFQTESDVTAKDLDVGGSLTVYFTDETLYNKVVNGTNVALAIQVQLATGDSYLIEFPLTTLDPSSKSVAAGGPDEIAPSFSFTASGSTQMRITRTLATAKPVFTLTYDGNSATSGTAPAAVTKNEAGAVLYASANVNALTKTSKTFNGWNTANDGSGTAYAVGAPIVIEEATTLYAVWS